MNVEPASSDPPPTEAVTRTATPPRNETIEGLRGLLASAVLVSHVYMMAAVTGGFYTRFPRENPLSALEELGTFAVCIFFMISGYLIVQTLSKDGSVRRFAKSRVTRLAPVFVGLHVLLFAVGPFAGYAWMGALRGHPMAFLFHFTSNLLMLPGIFDLPLAQKNAWSLSYELLFYVLAAAAFVFRGLARRSRILGAALGLGWGALVVWLLVRYPMGTAFVGGVVTYGLVRRIGVEPTGVGRSKSLTWISGRGSPLGLVLLGATFWLAPVSAVVAWLVGTAFFVTIALEQGLLSVFLRTRPMQALGRMSYSLYLVHPFVLYPFKLVFARMFGGPRDDIRVLLAFAVPSIGLALLFSWLCYRLIETRLTRFLLGRWNARTASSD